MKKLFATAVILGSTSILNAVPYSIQSQYSQGSPQGRNYSSNYYQGNDSGYYQDDQYNQQSNQYSNNQYDSRYNGNQGYPNNQYGSQQRNQGYYQQGYSDNRQNQQYGSYPNQKMNNSANASDQEIVKKIQSTLSSGWFSKGFEDVTFDVNNGFVVLGGSVDTPDNRKKIEDNVRKIDGVRQVDNQIVVEETNSKNSDSNKYSEKQLQVSENKYPQDTAETFEDRQLNARIRAKLGDGWFSKGYNTIVLHTENGAVTITGRVNNFDDIQKVTDELRKIDGIRFVNAQLIVQSNDKNSDSNQFSEKDLRDSENKYPQDTAATFEDRQLNAKIRSKLSGGWFSKGYNSIALKTSNGVVTVTGGVSNFDDVQKITDELRDIEGVRSINSHLIVRNN